MEDLKPGRELDALVAEKVLGCSVRDEPDEPWSTEGPHCGCVGNPHEILELMPESILETPVGLKHYSSDVGAAWELVEAMRAKLPTRDHRFTLREDVRSGWEAYWKDWSHSGVPDSRMRAVGESAAHAICLAALKTLSQ